MRLLLVHPDDSADRGPWAGQPWDQVLDLGVGGTQTYERWSRKLGCPAAPLDPIRFEEFGEIRRLLAAGIGPLRDREGLDWWELTAIRLHQQMEALIVLRRFVSDLGARDQVFVTRPGFHADALRLSLGERLHCFAGGAFRRKHGLLRYPQVLSKLSVSQILEILGDKYDACYAIRGPLARRREPSTQPVVLLPSAYVNVSRAGIAYARVLPETDFLLVTTRRGGWVSAPPANVTVARLASYASREPATEAECKELQDRWQALRRDLQQVHEISMLARLGCLDSFPRLLRQGLAIRNAWRAVFGREPVQAVLCGDDSNPYTHIPLLLGRNRGLPTLSCHHGAFDGRYLFKRNHADVILAKGRMEEDYLVRICGLPRTCVEVGAPAAPESADKGRVNGAKHRPFIVLFSEACEVSSGRAEEFYRDLLPPLADLARRTQRRLIVKLHPFESHRERQKLIKRVLTREQHAIATVVSGPLTDELLRKTWFGMTILSTVAMECAQRGIPCFLAEWLEYWPYGYIEQFRRFGVGYGLQSPAEISQIPNIMQSCEFEPELARALCQPISADRFQELISGSSKLEKAVAV